MSEDAEPVSIVTGVTEDKHEFVWKIQNFARLPKEGKQIERQKFEIHAGRNSLRHSKWVVGIKNNVNHSGAKFFHVYSKLEELLAADGTDELQAQLTVQLKDRNGSTYWTNELQGLLKVNECMEVEQRYWWNNSTNWNGLVDSSGTLTIYIKLSLMEPFPACGNNDKELLEKHFRMKSALMAQKNLDTLRSADSSEFDVKIVCNDGKEFKCHKAILIANSSVFSSMLQSDFTESKSGVINVTDISGKTMEIFLQYIYTGELVPLWCAPDVIVEFSYAAGKYQITELLEFLDNVLGSANNDKDATVTSLALLNLAQKMSLENAETQLLERIAKLAVSSKTSTEMLSLFHREE